jgi:redox-sensitive bicupin YhaK (pirin superfamily)
MIRRSANCSFLIDPMISVRRAEARHHDPQRRRKVWRTFDPRDRADRLADGFGTIEALDENRLPPRGDVPGYAAEQAEIVTYVREGTIVYEDAMGNSGAVHAGEFQRIIAALGTRHSETNASRADWAHVFQIRLRRTAVALEPGREQRRFTAAERRGGLWLIASPYARSGSLHLHHDTWIYSALLDPGQHVVHRLTPGRAAWLHIVQGEIAFGDLVLTTGDGAGVTAERSVSLTARDATELLLLDVVEHDAGGP